MSKLTNDLSKVANIVGELGLSIAKAQKVFNLDYMENIQVLLAEIKKLLGTETDVDKIKPVLQDLLKAMAPSRYQYTQTTLDVKLDLAQSFDFKGTVGASGGFGAVAINAAFTIGYGYDYRAAAQCRTVINAIPADQTVFQPLMENAKELSTHVQTLPTSKDEHDEAITKQLERTFKALTDAAPDGGV